MSKTRVTELLGKVRDIGSVQFLRAESSDEDDAPLVTVFYSIDGKEQDLGLRVDLDKQVFLDMTGITEVDSKLEDIANILIEVLSEAPMLVQPTPHNIALDKEIALDGLFWIGGGKIVQARGTLINEPTDGIRLKLSGLLAKGNGLPGKYPIILGKLTDGGQVTLLDCFETNRTFTSNFEDSGKSELIVHRCVFGVHADSVEHLKFRECRFRLDGLEQWLSLPFISQLSHQERSLKWSKSIAETFQLDLNRLVITFESGITTSSEITEFRLRQVAWIAINCDRDQPMDFWIDIVWRVQSLLSILVGEIVALREFVFRARSNNLPNSETECPYIFAQQNYKRSDDKLFAPLMVLPFAQIKSQAKDLFDRWFARFPNVNQALGAFFAAVGRPHTLQDFRLIGILTAIEIYGREIFRATNVPGSENSLIEFANLLPEALRVSLFGSPLEFMGKVVREKEHMLHGYPQNSPTSLDGRYLHILIEKLCVMFIALVLKDLGIDDATLNAAVRRSPRMLWAINERV